MWKERPIFGDYENLKIFDISINDYFTYNANGKKKFIFGHPELLNQEIDTALGYHKKISYLPFS